MFVGFTLERQNQNVTEPETRFRWCDDDKNTNSCCWWYLLLSAPGFKLWVFGS